MLYVFNGYNTDGARKLWRFYEMERRVTGAVWATPVPEWHDVRTRLDMTTRMREVNPRSSLSMSKWLQYMNTSDKVWYYITRNVPHGLFMSGATTPNGIVVVTTLKDHVLWDNGVELWRDYGAYSAMGAESRRKARA